LRPRRRPRGCQRGLPEQHERRLHRVIPPYVPVDRVDTGITTCSREPSGIIASTNGVLMSIRRPDVRSIRSTRWASSPGARIVVVSSERPRLAMNTRPGSLIQIVRNPRQLAPTLGPGAGAQATSSSASRWPAQRLKVRQPRQGRARPQPCYTQRPRPPTSEVRPQSHLAYDRTGVQ
jgi:hypothetical protein